MKKRVVVVSDFHSGHDAGLTPPRFDAKPDKDNAEACKLFKLRRECWNFFSSRIDALQPIDVLICNGDAIEGKGERSGGTELITADRGEQAEIAAACILYAHAKKVFMTYGTPYHTGADEDWENEVAKRVEAVKIGGHDWFDANGVIFDYKHFISGSTVPYGEFTPIAKDRLWNLLWSEHEEFPKGDILIRSHTHKFGHCCGVNWFAYVTPALQAYGGKHGTRRCQKKVDFGFIHFDVESRERWTWQKHTKFFPMKTGTLIKV